MPDYDSKRANPFPFPTATEVSAAPGEREDKAARAVLTRYVTGIPKRAFILGENDTSPMVRGVKDLTTAAYALLDALDGSPEDEEQAALNLRTLMEDHGCPDTSPMETNVG